MPRATKSELEAKFNCVVYVSWALVPANYHPRSWYTNNGVTIPKSAKPDAVKGGRNFNYYFLFKEENWLSPEKVEKLNIERRPQI